MSAVPSDMSDFHIHGGIYRPVHLRRVPAGSIECVGLIPTVAQDGDGMLRIEIAIRGNSNATDHVQLSVQVTDPEGVPVGECDGPIGETFVMRLAQAACWSPATPRLYKVAVRCRSVHGEHQWTGCCGFRRFEFVEHGPFMLNGERLLLRGTHRHEDHAGCGAAMTPEQIEHEMRMIKAMGCNFIRLGHMQQSRAVLELCDRLGLLVWEEIPWCRGGVRGDRFKKSVRGMLREMIEQHRNHVSVILWGLGNEQSWWADSPEYDPSAVRDFMVELHQLARTLDPTRPTALRACPCAADVVDVYSPSMFAGWYRARYTDYEAMLHREMAQYPRLLHAEWGADHHAGHHSPDPLAGLEDLIAKAADAAEQAGDFMNIDATIRVSKDGDWSETYACDLIDWHLMVQERQPRLTGSAHWIFKDFATPVRPENPIPYVNQKGVVERDGTPKESYYVFQSWWTRTPMVRIYGHSWPRRHGLPGRPHRIKIYSNCKRVECKLNGVSVGMKSRDPARFPACGLSWDLELQSGQHVIEAVGHFEGGTVSDRIAFSYTSEPWGAPANLALRPFHDGVQSGVDVEILDARGRLCLDAAVMVSARIAGAARLRKNQGTARGSSRVRTANGQARFYVLDHQGPACIAVESATLGTSLRVLEMPSRAVLQARDFIENEREFHLGVLPTEQPHPRTADLSARMARDTRDGVRGLLSVDETLVVRFREIVRGSQVADMADAMEEAIRRGNRIVLSGCGATGRLSLILESAWRAFWSNRPASETSRYREQLRGLITGGDRALVRSVEGFEDYQTFGRRQVQECAVGPGDVLVAVSEGGETSSVIGSAWQALEAGARVFFMFNNPGDVLRRHLRRSRELIEAPGVTVLDLTTGPMAIAGSTRMQAVTMEMAVLGAVLEQTMESLESPGARTVLPAAADRFDDLIHGLAAVDNIEVLAGWVDMEAACYRSGGRVTYVADRFLGDIMQDTTERSPTFGLPPFRRSDDPDAPESWAFVKHPVYDTRAAWRCVLGREPIGLDWSATDYAKLGADQSICGNPPQLNSERLYDYAIGNEPDPVRQVGNGSLVVRIEAGDERMAIPAVFTRYLDGFPRRLHVGIRSPESAAWSCEDFRLICPMPATPMRLWERLAVKIVFNTLSTATMVKLGYVTGNWMSRAEATNKKLIDRGIRLVQTLGNLPYDQACLAFHQTLEAIRRGEYKPADAIAPAALTLRRLRVDLVSHIDRRKELS